jgi:hypothetical protein
VRLSQAAAVVIAFGFVVVFAGFTMGVFDDVIPSSSHKGSDPPSPTQSIEGGIVGLILVGAVVVVTGATMIGDLKN